jgi:lambda family phage tail tape measure protein
VAERNFSIRLSVIDGGKVKAELREVGESGERSLKRIEAASRPASRGLEAINAAAGDLRGQLEGATSRLGPVGSALGRLGPAGLAAGAALALVSVGLVSSLKQAAEAERSYRRLEAVLKATGYASGLTGKEISDFAESLEETTLVSAETAMDAVAILATFRSISGDTFTRALKLAQDLSAVFGQDLRSSATQLGKALEEPVEGLNALRRVGVSFTASQRDTIKTLVETGQVAEAQKIILDTLEKQVGGAGAAEATGLTGAANRLSDSWGNLLKQIGRTPAIAGTAESALDLLARVLDRVRKGLEEKPFDSSEVVELTRKILETEDKLAKLRQRGFGEGHPVILNQVAILEQYQKRVEALIARGRTEVERMTADKRRAEEGRRAAEAERRAETLATQRKTIDGAIEKLADSPAERIAAVNRELAETKKRLEALRAADGSNADTVDAAIRRAEELARRKIAAIEKPAREAAARMSEADAKVLADLERQILETTDKRQAFIDQAVARLSKGATPAIVAQVERLAGALYDEKEQLEKRNKAVEEGRRLTEAHGSATEKFALEVEKLNKLQAAGTISAETYANALRKAEKDKLAASRDWRDGAVRALRDYAEESSNAAKTAEQVMTRALRAGEDAFVQWATTGKLSGRDLFNTLAEEALRAAYRIAFAKPLGSLLENLLGSIGSSLFGLFGSDPVGPVGDFPIETGPVMLAHGGGVLGEDKFASRPIMSSAFAAAQRLHGGGVLPGETPAILQRGEAVFTPGQLRALGAAIARPPDLNLIVNVDNRAPGTEARADLRREADGMKLDIVVEQVEGRLARNIGRGEGLAPTLERRYGLNPAAGSYR